MKRLLTGGLFVFLVACNNSTDKVSDQSQHDNRKWLSRIDSIKSLVKNGDLIFRNGTDEVSQAARSMNRIDTSFSHCGLVQVEHDSVFVYHAIGGKYNPSQRLRRELVDSFCIPPETDRFAVYRYALSPKQSDSLTAIIRKHYNAGLKFDLYFNFLTDEQMYCSEFVFKCLDKSLSGALTKEIEAREWPFGISPDDLFLSQKSRLIKRVDFLP